VNSEGGELLTVLRFFLFSQVHQGIQDRQHIRKNVKNT